MDVLVKVLRRAFERGDDVADVDSRRIPGPSATGCSEHSSRATTLRGRFQLVARYMKLANVRSLVLWLNIGGASSRRLRD
jgi:hypothetical protein